MSTSVQVIETKDLVNSTKLIHHGDEIQCLHFEASDVRFSYGAWLFFKWNFDSLLKLHKGYDDSHKVGISDGDYQLQIWNGPHVAEIRVAFIEGVGENMVEMDLTLQDPSGRGSINYIKEIREMLNAIE